jgi:ABC-type dipeptide/oligopeptide/nickel transport system permease component
LQLGWLQAGRWDQWTSAVLPMATLGAAPAAYLAALLRSTLIETFGEDFIRTARAKGVKESAVVLRHALRHSLIPVLTVMGPLTAALLTCSFVVEYVFAIPGMGRFSSLRSQTATTADHGVTLVSRSGWSESFVDLLWFGRSAHRGMTRCVPNSRFRFKSEQRF